MTESVEKPKCGVVMPISAIDGCSEGHWGEVYAIICEAIGNAGFSGALVSGADDVGIIQGRIIQNLYSNPIVVCDVSGKNPNVMFELGMRLAFDKPTIIIKDDKTSYSFDTSPIEHLEYPRDLRFIKIVEFKKKLEEKIKATYSRSQSDPSYTTFLKNFGEFKVAKIDEKEVSAIQYVIEELKSVAGAVRRLERRSSTSGGYVKPGSDNKKENELIFAVDDLSHDQRESIVYELASHPAVTSCDIDKSYPGNNIFKVKFDKMEDRSSIVEHLHNIASRIKGDTE